MSRGPLDVLRDMRADAACRVHSDVCDECKAYDEAIAQVEALVEAARLGADALERVSRAVPPDLAMLIGDRAMFLRHDLKPFSPGQDSEGGGND